MKLGPSRDGPHAVWDQSIVAQMMVASEEELERLVATGLCPLPSSRDGEDRYSWEPEALTGYIAFARDYRRLRPVAPGISVSEDDGDVGVYVALSRGWEIPIGLRRVDGDYRGEDVAIPATFFPGALAGFVGETTGTLARTAEGGVAQAFLDHVMDVSGLTPIERTRAENQLLKLRDVGWGDETLAEMWAAGRIVGRKMLSSGPRFAAHTVRVLTRFGPHVHLPVSEVGYRAMVGLRDLDTIAIEEQRRIQRCLQEAQDALGAGTPELVPRFPVQPQPCEDERQGRG